MVYCLLKAMTRYVLLALAKCSFMLLPHLLVYRSERLAYPQYYFGRLEEKIVFGVLLHVSP